MNFKFIGKDTVVSDALKEKITKKLNKFDKFLSDDVEIIVKCTITKIDHKIEVTIPIEKRVLRAEIVDTDMYICIDRVVDVLEKQLVKYKSRLRDKHRKENTSKSENDTIFVDYTTNESEHFDIRRSKKFALKPVDSEEAIMEMELLGHNFYVFRNSKTEEVNVVYKRNDGSYGLIEPMC